MEGGRRHVTAGTDRALVGTPSSRNARLLPVAPGRDVGAAISYSNIRVSDPLWQVGPVQVMLGLTTTVCGGVDGVAEPTASRGSQFAG